ncbi:hypothetical protein [Longimicrobium terrae]|nr:hypothetical protein [Longimicrobium terrae]MBB4637363.1 hypothetical protein [Longimicrobium terrae]NNC28521.1 hypothetical protein [Longimicrobium terrae]
MYLTQLSSADQDVAFRCLRAIYEGPFLDEFDFQTRTGVERGRLPALLERWPAADDMDDEGDDALLISNAMNEIANGVRLTDEEWRRWFGDLPREAVGASLMRWRELRDRS